MELTSTKVNDQEFWSSFMIGHKPTISESPIIYQEFINQLKDAGVNIDRKWTSSLNESTDRNE